MPVAIIAPAMANNAMPYEPVNGNVPLSVPVPAVEDVDAGLTCAGVVGGGVLGVTTVSSTVIAADATSLAALVSPSAATVAWSVNTDPASAVVGARPENVNVSDAPGARSPRSHVAMSPAKVHCAAAGDGGSVKPGGSAFVSVTPCAVDGPLLVTVTVNDAAPPGA